MDNLGDGVTTVATYIPAKDDEPCAQPVLDSAELLELAIGGVRYFAQPCVADSDV